MILLVLLSFILIAGYVYAMIKKGKEIPYSISATYYALTHKFWFALCMIGSGVLLLPAALESSTENSQFLVFLSVVGMVVLGVSPNFKSEQKVPHAIGAAMSLIFSQIWVGCNSWYWLLLWLGFIIYMVVSMKKHWTGNFISDFIKRKPMFWIEVISLLAVYLTCLVMTGGIVATILLPLIGAFQFYDSKKRKEAAAAKKAEAENITQYAAEWKELYEKKEAKVHELDTKIDQLYVEKNEDRERIRDLQSKNVKLELENQALNFKKCEVRGCKERKPPSDY